MPKVMLIEDDTTMVTLLKMLLEMEGFQVVSWRPVDDALKLLRNETPDIVLLDVNLANINGFDVLQKIRADQVLHDTNVIMSSGMDYSVKCLENGANAFLLKPYMPDDLISMIKQVHN